MNPAALVFGYLFRYLSSAFCTWLLYLGFCLFSWFLYLGYWLFFGFLYLGYWLFSSSVFCVLHSVFSIRFAIRITHYVFSMNQLIERIRDYPRSARSLQCRNQQPLNRLIDNDLDRHIIRVRKARNRRAFLRRKHLEDSF